MMNMIQEVAEWVMGKLRGSCGDEQVFETISPVDVKSGVVFFIASGTGDKVYDQTSVVSKIRLQVTVFAEGDRPSLIADQLENVFLAIDGQQDGCILSAIWMQDIVSSGVVGSIKEQRVTRLFDLVYKPLP